MLFQSYINLSPLYIVQNPQPKKLLTYFAFPMWNKIYEYDSFIFLIYILKTQINKLFH